MKCHTARRYFDDYLADRIGDQEKKTILEHLQECPRCREELDADRKLMETLRQEPVPDPGENYWHRLERTVFSKTIERLPPETAAPDSGQEKAVMRIYLLPLAAAFLLLMLSLSGISPSLTTAGREPIITAAPEADRSKIPSGICLTAPAAPSIISSLVTSLPGTGGRQMAIIDHLNNMNSKQDRP